MQTQESVDSMECQGNELAWLFDTFILQWTGNRLWSFGDNLNERGD